MVLANNRTTKRLTPTPKTLTKESESGSQNHNDKGRGTRPLVKNQDERMTKGRCWGGKVVRLEKKRVMHWT